MSHLGVGVSPGDVPVSHGSNLRATDRSVKLVELALRCVICGLSIVATAIITSDTEVKEIFSIKKWARFTDLQVMIFLVAANGIAAVYSLLQLGRCSVSLMNGSVLFSKPLAWVIFSGDQIMAYLMFSAVAASAQAGMYAQFGEPEMQWMKTCFMFKKFCNQMAVGVSSDVLVCLSMVLLSGISAFNLFRLYDNTGKKW